MQGIDNLTGKALAGQAHLQQSIRDILTTPIGTRVMRRDYGSKLFQLTDRPTTKALLIDLYAATAEALDRWEPRLRLTRVRADTPDGSGKVVLTLEGIHLIDGKPITLDGIEVT